MKRAALVLFVAVSACGGPQSIDSSAEDLDTTSDKGAPEPSEARVHWARGEATPGGAASSPNLVYHGGPVMTGTPAAAVQPIFWGTSWSNDTQDKRGWLNKFYAGMSASSYEATNTEYTQTGGAHVGTAFSVAAGLVDLSPAPRRANKTSTILAEVCRTISNPVSNGYYPVYTDTPRGH